MLSSAYGVILSCSHFWFAIQSYLHSARIRQFSNLPESDVARVAAKKDQRAGDRGLQSDAVLGPARDAPVRSRAEFRRWSAPCVGENRSREYEKSTSFPSGPTKLRRSCESGSG